jgi:3-phosphoshikimate 1-carboxyvinyltransferase
LVVHGAGGEIPALEADLFCANSGTTIRFLTALATLGHGSFRLDGVERMRQRPIGNLLEALNQLGTHASSENGDNCPPVVVHANGLRGGTAKIRGDISSQYLSGVLMAAARARSPVELLIDGPLVSQPYVRMTLAVMKSFGVDVETAEGLQQFHIAAPQQYRATEFAIEPDASAASYFWAAAAICGGEVTVEGLTADSLQGDVAFVECLEKMGCEVRRDAGGITVIGRSLRGIDVDMNAISDTVQTLAVVAIFAEGTTRIRHVGHIRHKETDRIGAVATELRKLGVDVLEHDDGLTIKPNDSQQLKAATIETYHDHRMAMSFALSGLRIPGVRITNPSCVEKTYPRFFEDLAAVVR